MSAGEPTREEAEDMAAEGDGDARADGHKRTAAAVSSQNVAVQVFGGGQDTVAASILTTIWLLPVVLTLILIIVARNG